MFAVSNVVGKGLCWSRYWEDVKELCFVVFLSMDIIDCCCLEKEVFLYIIQQF